LRGLPRPPDEHGQHLAIIDAGFFESLGIGVEWPAVEIELLRRRREVGFALHEGLEVLNGQTRWQIES
jgi:hypothetical protein